MITAAALTGIDSCPIEGFHQEEAALLKAKFGVDTDKYGLSYMIAFGYRKRSSKTQNKKKYRRYC
jgi:nitroreductase